MRPARPSGCGFFRLAREEAVAACGHRTVGERAAVLVRHHLHERIEVHLEGRARTFAVLLDERAHDAQVLRLELLERDLVVVATLRECSLHVEDVGDAAAHAGGEVASRRPEHDDDAARHVLAAVVANTLDNDGRTGVAYREPLADEAAEERTPARR